MRLQVRLGKVFYWDITWGYLRIGKKVRRWGKAGRIGN